MFDLNLNQLFWGWAPQMEKGSLSTRTVLDHFVFFKLGSYLALKLIVLSVSSPFFLQASGNHTFVQLKWGLPSSALI